MTTDSIGTTLLGMAFKMFKKQNEEARQAFYAELSCFYFRIQTEMEETIKKYFLKRPFSEKTLKNMFWFHDDIIDKIISRKTAGTLTMNPVVKVGDEQDEELDAFLYKINFWETMKEIYKRSKYFNTIMLLPVYDDETKEMRVDILQGDMCAVVPQKDYLKIEKLIIARLDENQEIYYVVWTETEHYQMDVHGQKKAIEGNGGMVNPFNKMVVPIYRDRIGWDFWGEPNIALFTFQMLHTMKVSDNERGEFYYKFPIGILKNIPFGDKDELSPGYLVKVENLNPNANIGIEYANSNTDWGQIRENEKARRDQFIVNQKIPSSSASVDVNVMSGYAKTIDELELVECKEEDKSNLLRFVYQSLENILLVAKHYGVIKKEYKMDNITITFQELKSYESEPDKWLRRENEKKFGMKDEIDFIMEDEGCSEPEAIAILEAKRARRTTLQLEDTTLAEPNLNNLFNEPAQAPAK